MNEAEFALVISSLKATVQTLRQNVELIVTHKRAASASGPGPGTALDLSPLKPILNENLVRLMDLKIKYRDVQIVSDAETP